MPAYQEQPISGEMEKAVPSDNCLEEAKRFWSIGGTALKLSQEGCKKKRASFRWPAFTFD
jgi:hypothetical protein